MKFIFIIPLAAVLFAAFTYPESKEPMMFLGHAEYRTSRQNVCTVWPIMAISQKQADSLFMAKVKEMLKEDTGVLVKSNYGVWQIKSCLKVNQDDINRSY